MNAAKRIGDGEVGENEAIFSFFKGADDVVVPKDGIAFDWDKAATRVRENLHDALNARYLSFLFGSGCSSLVSDGAGQWPDRGYPLSTRRNAGRGSPAGDDSPRSGRAAELNTAALRPLSLAVPAPGNGSKPRADRHPA